MKKVFYCKGRPQGADIAEFSIRQGRVFIGYPPWKSKKELSKNEASSEIVDIGKDDLSTAYPAKHRRQFSKNRNLVLEIDAADEVFVLLPRPSLGVCFIGKVVGAFRVEQSPVWADEYLNLRATQGLDVSDAANHIGDIVQCWPVVFSEKPIPFPLIPGWIRYQIMGRQTAGLVHNAADGIDDESVQEIAAKMYGGQWSVDLSATLNFQEVEKRLVRWLTPNAFEHLAVDLLQIMRPDERWLHVGGSGDGGADGMAFRNGETSCILQCKWKYSGGFDDLVSWLTSDGIGVFVASLLHDDTFKGKNALNRQWFTENVIQHRKSLPIAAGLGVCG